MNFTWCGQSCGSTSRAFVHRGDPRRRARARQGAHRGLPCRASPTDPATTMGAIVSRAQLERVLELHRSRRSAKARGWSAAASGPRIRRSRSGNFVEPTVFADVTPAMRIAREEIFGPVLAVLPWSRRGAHARATSTPVDYGLTCSIWTNDLVHGPPHGDGGRRSATSGSTKSASISSARRSAASSSPASGARNASRRCCASRRRRTST